MTLVEVAREPIENRRKYIEEHKPKHEIERRLRLLKKVKGRLPLRLRYISYVRQYSRGTNYIRYDYGAVDEIRDKYTDRINALHKKECPDCPWNGKTIFPKAYTLRFK
jgi:hypothetical protein